jgi:hypothetical protein
MAAEKPVVAAAPQSASVEAKNREVAKTQYADSGQYASDAPLMGVLERQQNPVAAAMQDLQNPGSATVITHGYQNGNNYGSLALRNVGDGRVNAYLGNGRGGNGQVIGEYDLNDPTSAAKLQNDLGVFVQNDAEYTAQHSRRPTYQHNNAAIYGNYYSRQQQLDGTYLPPQNGMEYRSNGYQGNGMYAPQTSGYGINDPRQMQMQQRYEQMQRMQELRAQQMEQNGYYNNANRAYGFNRRVFRDGEQDVGRATREMDRDFTKIGRGMEGMSNGRGGLASIFSMVAPVLNIGNRMGDVLPSIGGTSDPRPRASYPDQVQYPQPPQQNGYPSMYPQQYPNQQPQGYTYPPNNGGGFPRF